MVATLQGPFGLIVLNTPTLTIGSAPDNQLVINDANASSHHALIRVEAQYASIMDPGSANGTYLNEQRLEQNSPHLLNTGDSIRIGNTTFRYEERVNPSRVPPFLATPNRESDPGLQPDVQVKPFGHTAYGQQEGNPSPPFSGGYPPPPPPYNPNLPNPYDPNWDSTEISDRHTPIPPSNQMPREELQRQPFVPPPEQKKMSNQLKILLIAAAVLIGLGVAGGGIFIYQVTRPQPLISVSSPYEPHMTPAGATGTDFRVSGHNFSRSSSITFLLDGKVVPGNPAAQSDKDGNVTATLNVTSDWPLGDHMLTALDANGYTTKDGAALKIVPQGQAHTPGPNGAPPDDATFNINSTVLMQTPYQIKLVVTGGPDPSGGSVCTPGADGSQQTSTGTDNTRTYKDTYTFACSGTYKGGKLSFTETLTSDKFDYSDGETCTEHAPYVYIHLEGTFSNATSIGGSYSGESDNYDCTKGSQLNMPADRSNWTGQLQ